MFMVWIYQALTNQGNEMNTESKILEKEENVTWYLLNGTDTGTNYEFENATYGITDDGDVLDADGGKLTEGDYQTIAVRNAIRGTK